MPRTDLAAKLTGAAAYVHDLTLPGMVHARAVLPPTYQARPIRVPVEEVRGLPGVLAVVHDGGLVLVVAEREEQAVWAAARVAGGAVWDDPGLPAGRDEPATPLEVCQEGGVEAALAAGPEVTASYAKPYESHGSFAPSCAVALASDQLTVWTHSQGVYPLRRELAALLGEDESRLVVRHGDGPGCYGQNLADDAAAFAALAARAVPGRPVRFQFSVRDEFGWEPYGPAMLAFRLAHLDDRRAREVLERAAATAGWRDRPGQGLAVARYKGSAAYVAQVVEVEVDRGGAVRVVRVVTACDAGGIVNPDGLHNQLEGGTLQGLSRALHERVRFGPDGIGSRDWTGYPVLRFREVPRLETVLLDRPGWPPLGAGEAATPVTPAALVNAVATATGTRVRELPLRLDG